MKFASVGRGQTNSEIVEAVAMPLHTCGEGW